MTTKQAKKAKARPAGKLAGRKVVFLGKFGYGTWDRERLEHEDLCVLAFRFDGDRHCRAERFAAYRAALGPRFVARVLPDAVANPEPPPFFRDVVGCPHSVFTAHLIDAEGELTLRARDEVIAFLRGRLYPEPQFEAETVV